VYITERDFEKCLPYFAEAKKKLQGKDSGSLKTNEIMIDATKDVTDLVVKFDFPGC
jgi:hypothetical protein